MHGKETVYLYPGLFTCTQLFTWPSLGAWRIFFLIFLQDRKSTSLLTVIKTLAQIPRINPIFCLTMDISAEARGRRVRNPIFLLGFTVPQLKHSIISSSLGYCFFPLLLCNLQAVKFSLQHGGGDIHGPGIQTGGKNPSQ